MLFFVGSGSNSVGKKQNKTGKTVSKLHSHQNSTGKEGVRPGQGQKK